jgi:hypothetical protein
MLQLLLQQHKKPKRCRLQQPQLQLQWPHPFRLHAL